MLALEYRIKLSRVAKRKEGRRKIKTDQSDGYKLCCAHVYESAAERKRFEVLPSAYKEREAFENLVKSSSMRYQSSTSRHANL